MNSGKDDAKKSSDAWRMLINLTVIRDINISQGGISVRHGNQTPPPRDQILPSTVGQDSTVVSTLNLTFNPEDAYGTMLLRSMQSTSFPIHQHATQLPRAHQHNNPYSLNFRPKNTQELTSGKMNYHSF